MDPVIVSCEDSVAEFSGQGRGGYALGCTAFALTGRGAFGESPDVQLRIIIGIPAAQRGARVPCRFRRFQTFVEKKGQLGGGHTQT